MRPDERRRIEPASGATKRRPVRLAIIGGGAAGMFAASVAAERGIPCVLVERKARLGSKVLMTANGRCNFTRDLSPDQFLADIGATPHARAVAAFAATAVRACPPRKIIQGFKSLGMPVRRMADGRMFPADGKAATVVHAFGDLLRDREVPILTNCPVQGVERLEVECCRLNDGMFVVHTKNFDIVAENVLIATGGVSYPKTGSVGDGQEFAKRLGHRIVPYRPGLIGLETSDRRVVSHAGQRFEDGRCKVLDANGRVLYDYVGEVDCERFGISGAAVYNCQRFIEHLKLQPIQPTTNNQQPTTNLAIEVWFGRERLRFENLRSRPVKEAIVTLGGVSMDEIDPNTMESKLVPHLYFAGEVADIDGPTGGYNLTLAFATARLAVASIKTELGTNSAQRERPEAKCRLRSRS